MEVTLRKNGWHRKLQEYVFSNPPTFNNLCPYFWLTVFCFILIFIIPVMPIWRSIIWIAKKTVVGFDRFLNWCDRKICQPMFEELAKNMQGEDVAKSWAAYNAEEDKWRYQWELPEEERKEWFFWTKQRFSIYGVTHKERDKRIAKFKLWKKNNPDWEKQLEDIKEKQRIEYAKLVEESKKRREEEDKRQTEKDEREHALSLKKQQKKEEQQRRYELNKERILAAQKKRQKMFTNIVKYTKYLAFALAGALILGLLYVLYLGVSWIVVNVNWMAVLGVLKWIGIALLIIAGVVGVSYLLAKLIKKCVISTEDFPRLKKTAKVTGNIFSDIFKPFGKYFFFPIGGAILWVCAGFFRGIVKVIDGFKFIGMYIKETKGDYCPAINWVEEEQQEKQKVNP